MILTKFKVKDKEHLKLECLVQVGTGVYLASLSISKYFNL